MTPFATDQWVMLLLAFLLGLFAGMYLLSGRKWKRRYREEARLHEETRAENKRLHSERHESDSLRGAAARTPGRDTNRGPL